MVFDDSMIRHVDLGRGERQLVRPKIHSEPMANDPRAVAVLANTGEWCQAVLDDIESAFRQRHGAKWTPELQQVFQGLRESVMRSAAVVDAEFARSQLKPLQRQVLLSNYGEDGR